MTIKKRLRKEYRDKRSTLTSSEVTKKSLLIARGLDKMPIWHFFLFHTFLPLLQNKEVDTNHCLELIWRKGKKAAAPRMISAHDQEMLHYALKNPPELATNPWGIPEPIGGELVPTKVIDVVLVPLLVFDKLGNRIGYGKGYYDRFLASCRKDVVKIGVSFFPPEDNIEDAMDGHDIKLNYCITPEKTYRFSTVR